MYFLELHDTDNKMFYVNAEHIKVIYPCLFKNGENDIQGSRIVLIGNEAGIKTMENNAQIMASIGNNHIARKF